MRITWMASHACQVYGVQYLEGQTVDTTGWDWRQKHNMIANGTIVPKALKGAYYLNDLADVNTAGESTGEVLTFNGTKWVAAAPASAPVNGHSLLATWVIPGPETALGWGASISHIYRPSDLAPYLTGTSDFSSGKVASDGAGGYNVSSGVWAVNAHAGVSAASPFAVAGGTIQVIASLSGFIRGAPGGWGYQQFTAGEDDDKMSSSVVLASDGGFNVGPNLNVNLTKNGNLAPSFSSISWQIGLVYLGQSI